MSKLSLEQKVEELWARQQILDLMVRWCRAVDRCDEKIIAGLYWDNGTDDHGELFRGRGSDFARYAVVSQLKEYTGTNHFITNHLVEFDRNDRNIAYGETYCVVSARSASLEWTAMARLLERFECRDDEWRIAHNQVVWDWRKCEPIKKLDGPDLQGGSRDRSDPSYILFQQQ